MAGNKINTKTKGKDDKSRASKTGTNNTEETEDLDFALLRKPILTSITGFAQARKIFDLATEELKGLLSNECDLLYECKVCRNIFRSLANFISHKRVYCKETFNSSIHSHFFKSNSTANELLKIKHTEDTYQSYLKEQLTGDANKVDERIPLTKDLTAVVEKISRVRGLYKTSSEQDIVTLEKIPSSSVAMFQNINYGQEDCGDNIGAQVKELDNMLSKDNAVLQHDGKVKIQSNAELSQSEQDNVIQISDDEDDTILKCKICDLQFSTMKTLKFHMKYKHLSTRLVYPCPDCLEIFSTSWSVYRHLFKVHRKSAAQIRRLRESIQAKAFIMNNPPAFYEKKKNNMKSATIQKISEEDRLDQENQAWMDNMEQMGAVPRCGGCGRTFERRAALAAHTHTCAPRTRALRRPDKRIEIQIRKDYHKEPPPHPAAEEHKVADVAAAEAELKKEADDGPAKPPLEEATMEVCDEKPSDVANATDTVDATAERAEIAAAHPPDVAEDVDVKADTGEDADRSLPTESERVTRTDIGSPPFKLRFSQQAERSNLKAFRETILPAILVDKLLCKRCGVTFPGASALYTHMAAHYRWLRYACKLCNFKHYEFERLPDHVRTVHKLKGDPDFYSSTVKAIDGNEALELSEYVEDVNESVASPESRRPSRASSDSSRLSDDSSSSATRPEPVTRKRKIRPTKNVSKRKKDSPSKVSDSNEEKDDSMDPLATADNSVKNIEENSSDFDDLEEKLTRKLASNDEISSIASRRPVRKKTKPKNEDFEYDLSNLLKMEAQGYRESQSTTTTTTTTTKTYQTKKTLNKILQDALNTFELLNRDNCGALLALSKKSVTISAAHMKEINFGNPKEQKTSKVFVRPMIPKNAKEKTSPKKDDELKDASPIKVKNSESQPINTTETKPELVPIKMEEEEQETETPVTKVTKADAENESQSNGVSEVINRKLNIPSVVPIKFRRQSLEVMKNPLINKNITDFTKAGMKTKILVIKPINRKKEGSQVVTTPLKFQTIKLKDPNKGNASSEETPPVLVKIPKVDTITRSTSDSFVVKTEKLEPPSETNVNDVKLTTKENETAINNLVENSDNYNVEQDESAKDVTNESYSENNTELKCNESLDNTELSNTNIDL